MPPSIKIRSDMQRTQQQAVLIQYLPDIVATLVLFLMSVQLDGIGPIVALAWLGLFALLLLSRPMDLWGAVKAWWPLLLVPLVCLMSFIWSDLPEVSARYGFQFLLTAFVGVFLAYCLGPKRFARALMLAMLVFCLLSILSGRQAASAEGMVMVGLTGSKNQMAYAAHMLLASALAILFDKSAQRWLRLSALFGLLLAIFFVVQAKAATALIMGAVSSGVFFVLLIARRLRPASRIGLLVAAALVMSPFAFAGTEVEEAISTFRSDVLHKDEGLTGRAYLWARADDLIQRRPILGYGYMATWLNYDNPNTAGLLRWAGQTDGRAFHFHHTYRQIAVDTGLLGMTIFALTMIAALLAGLRSAIMAPTIYGALFFSFFVAMFLRSFADVIIGTFSTQPAVLYSSLFFVLKYANSSASNVVHQPIRTRPAFAARRLKGTPQDSTANAKRRV